MSRAARETAVARFDNDVLLDRVEEVMLRAL
jgi:hypothetical protein